MRYTLSMRGCIIDAAWLLFVAGFGLGQPTLLKSDEVFGRMEKQFAGGLPACAGPNQQGDGADWSLFPCGTH